MKLCCCIAIAAVLEEALGGTARITLQAISFQEAAVQAVNFHAQKLREAMEDTQVSRTPDTGGALLLSMCGCCLHFTYTLIV